MTKARNIANIASDGSALADGTINYTDVSGTPTLATVATSGAYADVTGTPTLAAVATSGSFNDLSNQPSPFDPNTLATVATTGAYADVTGTPTLATVATSGAYADVTGTPTLATVATTGAYADVTGTPTLATVATTGAYADVTGTPTLATVATTGAYGDLSGTPAAALPLAGGTLTGNVNLGDNVKANFGASSDLQIYHDGGHSFISDQGQGNLNILANNYYVSNPANTEYMISAVNDGTVTLYHNSADKLATTATGVTVTGTVAATSYTGDGSALTGLGGIAPTAGSNYTVGYIATNSSKYTYASSYVNVLNQTYPIVNGGEVHQVMSIRTTGTITIRVNWRSSSTNWLGYCRIVKNNSQYGSEITNASTTFVNTDINVPVTKGDRIIFQIRANVFGQDIYWNDINVLSGTNAQGCVIISQ